MAPDALLVQEPCEVTSADGLILLFRQARRHHTGTRATIRSNSGSAEANPLTISKHLYLTASGTFSRPVWWLCLARVSRHAPLRQYG